VEVVLPDATTPNKISLLLDTYQTVVFGDSVAWGHAGAQRSILLAANAAVLGGNDEVKPEFCKLPGEFRADAAQSAGYDGKRSVRWVIHRLTPVLRDAGCHGMSLNMP
jgi:hypothetical protein